MGKVTVRVSMFDHPIEVDEDEVANLRQQGLLVEDQPEPDAQADPDPDPAPADTKPARKPTKAPEPTKET